jgi:capsular polysaccharide biosynthesis protein
MPGQKCAMPEKRCTNSGAVEYSGICLDTQFTLVTAPSELGRLLQPHRLLLYPEAPTTAQIALFREQDLPGNLVLEHNENGISGPVYVYGLTGHELGGYGMFQSAGRVFLAEDIIPTYFNNSILYELESFNRSWGGSLLKENIEVIEVDGPVAVALHPNLVYGHFILEMLPRLHLLACLRDFGCVFPLAVPYDCPEWIRGFISRYFADDELIFYDAYKQRIRATCFILPSMMHRDYHFHYQFNAVPELLCNFVLRYHRKEKKDRMKLYLSRSRLPSSWHGISNENDVEQSVKQLGFLVCHPHEMTLEEQLSAYANASCIASTYGSAIHNSLFAPRGSKVFVMNTGNYYQSRIGALRGQRHAFMRPASGRWWNWRLPLEEQEQHYSIDCSVMSEMLAAFVNEE